MKNPVILILSLFLVIFLSNCQSSPPPTSDTMDSSTEETLSAKQYYQMGLSKLYGDWDYQGGKEAFLKAISEDPMFAEPYAHLGWYTILEQDREAAEQYIVKAKMLEPQKATWVLWHAWICYYFRDYECTEQYIDEALEMDPDLSEAHLLKGMMYYNLEKMEESIQWLNLAARDSARLYALGMSYNLQNKTEEAMEVIREVEEKNINNKELWLVLAYIFLEKKEQALHWFEETFHRKNPSAPWLQYDPIAQPFLKDETRFQELVKKMGRPERD